jgi:tetratricopeptide (TPR) repeat protein
MSDSGMPFDRAMTAGRRAMRRGSFHSALRHFEDALTEDPASALAHAQLSLGLARLDRRFGAEIEAERALSLDPLLPLGHIAHGYAVLDMGDEKGAREAVAKVLSFDPDDINALQLECSISLWEREAARLRKAASDLLAREPENAFGQYMLSRAFSMEGKGREAEALAREALREAPEDAMAHEAIGWAFLAQGKVKEAKQAALNAVQLSPDEKSATVLFAAAMLRARPLTGWAFRPALWMMGSSERTFITAALVFMAVLMLSADVLTHYKQNLAIDALNIASWAVCIFWVGSVVMFNRILAQESQQVRLSADY